LIVFFDHHRGPPSYHPTSYVKDKPDFVAARQSHYQEWLAQRKGKSRAFPWHLIESACEQKPEKADCLGQTLAYTGALRQARPDKPGVYGLFTRSSGYGIIWDDPAGSISTTSTRPWSEIGDLVCYVNSLYYPPDTHPTRDPTVKLARDDIYANRTPLWEFDGIAGSFSTIFVGNPHSRMSRVHRLGETTTVLKDSYRTEGRRFQEVKILEKIHGPVTGVTVPGVVQFDRQHSHDVTVDSKPIATPAPDSRTYPGKLLRTRLLMTSYGDSLRKCKTVYDGLKVLYDVVKVRVESRGAEKYYLRLTSSPQVPSPEKRRTSPRYQLQQYIL